MNEKEIVALKKKFASWDAFLDSCIRELKGMKEKPKPKPKSERGFIIQKDQGFSNDPFFFNWAKDWTWKLQDAYLFKTLEEAMEMQATLRIGSNATFLVTEAIRDKNRRLRRLP